MSFFEQSDSHVLFSTCRLCGQLRLFVHSSAALRCCGFGYQLYHKQRHCKLDVLVLALSDAPFGHGELPWWPPWSIFLAWPTHRLSALWRRAIRSIRSAFINQPISPDLVFVIPEDIYYKVQPSYGIACVYSPRVIF